MTFAQNPKKCSHNHDIDCASKNRNEKTSNLLIYEINREDVLVAVKNLNEAWSYLYPSEQRKILDILVGSIQVKDGGVKMKLNLDGLNRLLFEVA